MIEEKKLRQYLPYSLSYLLYVDSSYKHSHGGCTGQTSIWHPNSLKALLGQGLGSTQATNEPNPQMPPQNWMHFRLGFKIILPLNIISILCALLNSAEMDGSTTVHTCTQSIQICLTWQLSNTENSYYSMTVLGLRQDSGQAL